MIQWISQQCAENLWWLRLRPSSLITETSHFYEYFKLWFAFYDPFAPRPFSSRKHHNSLPLGPLRRGYFSNASVFPHLSSNLRSGSFTSTGQLFRHTSLKFLSFAYTMLLLHLNLRSRVMFLSLCIRILVLADLLSACLFLPSNLFSLATVTTTLFIYIFLLYMFCTICIVLYTYL